MVGLSLIGRSQALAQTPQGDGDQRAVVLAPTLRLSEVGWDDNVYRVNKSEGPVGDFTATFSPAMTAAIRVSRLQLRGSGNVDFLYFGQESQIRSIDTVDDGQVSVVLGLITPYIGG